ncbi:hypothetical protein BGZ49_001857 [Haplosporangium sp. Z 27]|nr:hypothetical protein BGZ49_001857 [Haplosporangium sp. Z 27]
MDVDIDHDRSHISSSASDRSSSSSPFPDTVSTIVSVPSSKSTTPGTEIPPHIYDILPGNVTSYIDLQKSSASLWTASASSSSSSLSSAHLLAKSSSELDLISVPDSTQSLKSDNDNGNDSGSDNIEHWNIISSNANNVEVIVTSDLKQQHSTVQRQQDKEQGQIAQQYSQQYPADLLWSRPSLLSLPLVEKMCDTMTLDRSETLFPYPDYVRRLNFSFLAQDLTDDILVQFDCCKRLERLLLPGSNKTTEDGLKQILKVGRGLYSLDMSEIPAVNDSVMEHVAMHCPKLHTLYLTGCSAITDESVVKLASNCPSLKRIKLGQCTLLTDRSILALTRNCPQLMEIDVTNCNLMTNSAIQSVFQTLPQIRDINMTHFGNLSDQAFSFIPIGSPSTSNIRFDQLRVLNLTSCVLITDETLARIIPAAPRLRNLTLTKCDRITDASANAIKLLGKHLHYLHLGHCSKLTDKAIATLTQHCTRIRYLDLACCSKLTDAAVFAMAQLPKLRRIGLVKCSNITDHGIYAMLVSQIVPQTLERVHLSYCIHLSDTAVAALVNQCSKLTHLSLTGVPAFMSAKYQKFCRVPPSEFTAHQREVFCVFSGKGVRELRQYMHDHPTVPSSTLSGIQRSYRIMGSTVASMVAGGQHSSSILAHLGFTLRETENRIQSLAAQNTTSAATTTTVTENGEDFTETPSSFVIDAENVDDMPDIESLSTSVVETSSQQQQQENEVLELEQQMEEMDQAEFDYAEMMMQQHLMLRRHHHHHKQQRHRYHHHEGASSSTSSPSSSSGSTLDISESTSAAEQVSSSTSYSSSSPASSSSSSSSTMLSINTHLSMCPHHFTKARLQKQQRQLRQLQQQQRQQWQLNHPQREDVRMTSPGPADQESDHTTQGQVEGESGEGSTSHGSPITYEEEDLDEDVFGDDDDDEEDSSRSRRRR